MSEVPKPIKQTAPGAASDSQFMKEFEQAILSYAEAVKGDRPEEAQQAAMQALLMAGEEALRNPTPSIRLAEEAANCADKGDWVSAEAAYRKRLALQESEGNFGIIAKAQMDLCRLLRLLGRLDESWQFSRQATASARRANIFPVLVMALDIESLCSLDREDYAGALKAASEAVQIIEPGKMYASMRAKALVARAKCLLATGDLAGADLELASSWEILNARSGARLMPGPLLTLANWWEVKSKLEEQRGNVDGAKEAMARAIENFRLLPGPYARVAVARALDRASGLSTLAGDSLAAENAASEAKAIRRDLHLVLDN